MKRVLVDFTLWFVWVPMRRLLKMMPLSFSYFLAGLAADAFSFFPSARRGVVMEELRLLYGRRLPEERIPSEARRAIRLFFTRQVENLLFSRFTGSVVMKSTTIEGLENLDDVLVRGKGAIMLLAHYGSFMLPLPALAYRGYRIMQLVGKPLHEEKRPIHWRIHEARVEESSAHPFAFVRTDQSLRPVIRGLAGNGVVVIAFDGLEGKKWTQVRLINRIAEISTGPFRLAAKSGAGIVPTFVIQEAGDRRRIIIHPEIRAGSFEDEVEAFAEQARQFGRIFESYLEAHPDHFAMTLVSHRHDAERGLSKGLFVT